MRIIEEHLVMLEEELGDKIIRTASKVIKLEDSKGKKFYFLRTYEGYEQITTEQFEEYNKNICETVFGVSTNKTLVSDWIKGLVDSKDCYPTVRMMNILKSMSQWDEYQYIEDIEPKELLRWRNSGRKTTKEFIELRYKGNPMKIAEELMYCNIPRI